MMCEAEDPVAAGFVQIAESGASSKTIVPGTVAEDAVAGDEAGDVTDNVAEEQQDNYSHAERMEFAETLRNSRASGGNRKQRSKYSQGAPSAVTIPHREQAENVIPETCSVQTARARDVGSTFANWKFLGEE